MNTRAPTGPDISSGQELIYGDVPIDPLVLREERIAMVEAEPREEGGLYKSVRLRAHIAWRKLWRL